MRRLFWLGVGAAAGASGTIWTQRRVKEQLDNLGPETAVAVAGRGAKAIGRTVSAAISEGRAAMAEREDELEYEMNTRRGRHTNGRRGSVDVGSRSRVRSAEDPWPTSTPKRAYR